MVPAPRYRHPFVRTLQRALAADARRDVDFAVRVCVLRSRGFTRAEVAERLDVSEDELRGAYGLLDRAGARRAGPARRRF